MYPSPSDGADSVGLSKTELAFPCALLDNSVIRTKELTLKQVFAVGCPTCGAAHGQHCELRQASVTMGFGADDLDT
jgi:hypothetical protein